MRQITVAANTFAGIQLDHIIVHASKAPYYMRIITIVMREDVKYVYHTDVENNKIKKSYRSINHYF